LKIIEIFFFILFIIIAGVASGEAIVDKAGSPENFNLLVITIDTLRADSIGAYGYEPAITPNLDKLAREGVLFENCYSPVPLTLPSHSSIFTGRYPPAHGVRDHGTYMLPEAEITLAEKMKEKGYHTFGLVSAFVLLSKFGISQGFDVFDDSLETHKMYNNFISEIPATSVYKKFLHWFEKNHNKQFFAWIHLYDPHTPYKAPKQYAEKFKDDLKGQYDAEIAFTDEVVGKIIAVLERKNILENTLVVIMSDHGEAFGEHEEQGHGIFCYDEVLKVPMIFYNLELLPQKGLRVKNRVNLVDFMPTILELYGMDIPSGVQGKSFASLLTGENESEQRNFYFESMHGKEEMNWAPLTGIIDGNYKYISLPESELYDLEKDSGEKENLFLKKKSIGLELDKKLVKQVAALSGSKNATDARRQMSTEDIGHLASLGYISDVSDKTSIGLDPKNGIALDNKIKMIFRILGKGEIDKAEAEFNKLTSKYSDIATPPFYDLKFMIYVSQKKEKEANVVLREALEKFPENERFHLYYALELFRKGEFKDMEASCYKLLQLNPRLTRAHILLGEMEEKRKNAEKAIEHYKKALDVEPLNISLKMKYAELLAKVKEYKTAIRLYDELLERKEVYNNPDFLFKIAVFNRENGSIEKAERLLKRSIGIDPKGLYYFNYALVLFENKKNQEAIKNMEIALNKYRFELNQYQLRMAYQSISLWKEGL